jgi:adenosine deaminase
MNDTASYPAWIDLHLHLDGSISIKTARKLAEIQGIALPEDDEELRQRMSITEECRDLNDYLGRFDLACSLLMTREGLYVCAKEFLKELEEQGLQYAEIRFAPQHSMSQTLTQYEAAEAVLQAIRESSMPCGLILSMMRHDTTHRKNRETVEVAKALHGKGVVAVDLAGAEALFPTYTFHEEFAAVRAAGIPLIVHAGEAAGAQSVREAIEAGAVRIGHGVRALEDPSVVQLLVERAITLELCPTSNLNTGIFASYKEYPLRRLMEAGVRVSINTDNMTVSNTTLRREWDHMIRAFRLTDEEIAKIVSDTQKAAFR